MGKEEIVKQEGKYVGVFLPQHIGSYLGLYTLRHSLFISDIVRNSINDWYVEKVKDEAVEKLLQCISQKLQKEWEERKQTVIVKLGTNPDKIQTAFELFALEMENELVNKVEKSFVLKIIGSLKI